MKIHPRPSPNHNMRPRGRGPELVVIHGTAGSSPLSSLLWLCDPKSQVSAHYFIDRDPAGTIYQLVPESRRAWHAGRSRWQGREDVNDFSIGIEVANKGPDPRLYREGETYPQPYTDAQYRALGWLCADISRRRGLPLERFVGHFDVDEPDGRKPDPWEHFDWPRFREELLDALLPPPRPPELALGLPERPVPPRIRRAA